MERSIRIGVIGAGWFASRRHLPEIEEHPEVELTAICRRDKDALERLKNRFKPKNTFTDWRQMLDQCPLDAVLIATPPALHYEQAHAALERGLHVLLEKPMTVHASEARELHKLATARGLKLSVALNPPFERYCHYIRENIRAKLIGKIEAIDLYWTGNAEYVFGEAPQPANLPGIVPPTMYRADPELCGGGFLNDNGPHLISEVIWVSDLKPTRVACLVDNLPSDRRAVLIITLENEATATITCMGNSKLSSRRVRKTFGGSKGTISVETVNSEGSITTDDGVALTFQDNNLPPVPGPVTNMIDAIRERNLLLSPADHGVLVTEVIEAAYRSATTHQTVTLQEDQL